MFKDKIKKILQNNSNLERNARNIIGIFQPEYKIRSDWSFSPAYDIWTDVINKESSEKFSGIHEKISQIQKNEKLVVIGGLSTGGSDEIFFHDPHDAIKKLNLLLEEIHQGWYLLIYSPHPFWYGLLNSKYRWIPNWDDLFRIFIDKPDWNIIQYSTSFDISGRYFFIAQKVNRKKELSYSYNLSNRTFHVFYFREGNDLNQSLSNKALSAHLCHAISKVGAQVFSHDMNDLKSFDRILENSILIGHVGPWVKEAQNRGFKNIILFNPANNWYPTRNSSFFESNATIQEQVEIAQLIIAQSGATWRYKAEVPFPEKWRWIDIGVDPHLFPKIKKSFNPPGKRRFLFMHLYDTDQKGADIAKEIIQLRNDYLFTWIGGIPVKNSNVLTFPRIHNTSKHFRNEIKKCDFLLLPSKEDAQPGVFVETASLGLIPVSTYSAGYSISFPKVVIENNAQEWVAIIDRLQNCDNFELLKVQQFFRYYLDNIHDWSLIESQILVYLSEFL